MFRTSFVMGLRSLLRDKTIAAITIAGFAVGITCSLLIFLYVRYELGYDRYHEHAERIFRLEIDNWAATPIGVAPFMKQTFPGVIDGIRFLRANRTLVGTDTSGAFLINEKAAALFGWTSPVGQRIDYPSQHRSGLVVGVLKDFNFASLHSEIEPLVLCLYPRPAYFKYISLRLREGDKAQAIAAVGKIWKNILPGRPMDFYFLDDSFRSLYLSEMRLKSIVTTFTLLAAFISCLGLLGLIAQIAARRTKEIGIRKVLGASMPGVAGLLAKDFLRLVLIANVIAWPIAWYVMNRWLEQFAYHVPIEWWDFVVAGGGAVILTLLTVSVQAIRAARTNPIEALRYE